MSRAIERAIAPPGLRRAALLAPALSVIVVLFGGGLAAGARMSLGHMPALGETGYGLGAYARLLADPVFYESLAWTLYLAGVSTVLASIVAVAGALALRRAGGRAAAFVFQLPLTVPHLVAAAGVAMLVSQSGLIARAVAAAGGIEAPAEFPALVNDPLGVAIILTYMWKEAPFIALIVLAALRGETGRIEAAARTLGATPWRCFWHITLPRIAPSVTVAAVFVFAFTFGAFEIPLLLGPTYPDALPVAAFNAYRSVTLADRVEAMALAMVIAAVSAALCLTWFGASRRWLEGR